MRTEPAQRRYSTILRLLAFLLLLLAGFLLFASVGFDFERLVDMVRATNPWIFLALMSLLPLVGFQAISSNFFQPISSVLTR